MCHDRIRIATCVGIGTGTRIPTLVGVRIHIVGNDGITLGIGCKEYIILVGKGWMAEWYHVRDASVDGCG